MDKELQKRGLAMNNFIKYTAFTALIIGFVLVRLFENHLFYDPLIKFYDGNFQNAEFPELAFWKYNLSLAFRYVINAVISIGLIGVLFQNKIFVKFTSLLLIILFIVCIILFWMVENNIKPEYYMYLFYIRRFLIQPLLIIVLIPAFYFQKLNKQSKSH